MLNCDLFAIHNCLKRSQFCIATGIENNIVNDKKGHNIANDSFADKPDGFLVEACKL